MKFLWAQRFIVPTVLRIGGQDKTFATLHFAQLFMSSCIDKPGWCAQRFHIELRIDPGGKPGPDPPASSAWNAKSCL
jgi:hypothetical protein